MGYDKGILTAQLVRHEGLRLKMYKCPAGAWSIGVGRNLDVNGVSEKEAMFMLENDIRSAEQGVAQILTRYRINLESVGGARFAALVNVCFNIGYPSMLGFVRMFRAIRQENWNAAAAELLDSKYADDVGRRAVELSNQLLTGNYQNVENG